eukprot:TRINITY_DN1823_c0_g1_i1.p1 TRINITY_DN1823_c0_g1~~TRINITY_DN1823_c0_g1_i1.p1  ORF type:complete len:296 (+),score=14.27 TRINITY_DN1823_c0_g1_i1:50-937(+)
MAIAQPNPSHVSDTWKKMQFVLHKLFTKEDNNQLHKTLGFLSICSFIYRYCVIFPKTGHLGFSEISTFNLFSILLHVALSTSSLIFHVLKKRILNRPMIIWEEYRQHAILFTVRAFGTFLFGWYRPFKNTWMENVALFVLMMGNHYYADIITQKHGSKNHTTVRVDGDVSFYSKIVLRFYSFYQFAGITSILIPNPYLSDLSFNSLIAIQSSAFLMTLYRKSIISWITHGVVYTLCLVISISYMLVIYPTPMFLVKAFAAFLVRWKLGVNKYLIWSVFALCHMEVVQELVYSYLG